ncbi:hypothetical protein [Streptomyces sp. Ncost-T10-10d]|uniref:hypothetical protein n=1 Tax=Streptomyces sp. Ncost-T10-10d TaxID=1839774 RepID=UPI00081EDCC6|nr:hypothetical protein [Streptomyces sp. Ncost-T10-10d]SCF84912.1 hypothetical protein GA0115254_119364 [Streptomyces sp. Ncost-T10-10d]
MISLSARPCSRLRTRTGGYDGVPHPVRAPFCSGSLLPSTRPADAECAELRVRPVDEVLATFRFHAVEEIDLDVDPVEAGGDSGATAHVA